MITQKRILISMILLLLNTSISEASMFNDQTVKITASGLGSSSIEARNIALRSAIEQAYGVFVSSKTDILNDVLIKDEIITVSSGNVQSFEILNEVDLGEGKYSVTLNAVVSVSKLISYAQSKGFEIEFAGGLFAFNINQQKLNESNEAKAIAQLAPIINSLASQAFDFKIQTDGSPQAKSNDFWGLKLNIEVSTNANYLEIKNVLQQTLKGVSLTEEEAAQYRALNKPVFEILIREKKIITERTRRGTTNREVTDVFKAILRSKEAYQLIGFYVHDVLPFHKNNFIISNDIGSFELGFIYVLNSSPLVFDLWGSSMSENTWDEIAPFYKMNFNPREISYTVGKVGDDQLFTLPPYARSPLAEFEEILKIRTNPTRYCEYVPNPLFLEHRVFKEICSKDSFQNPRSSELNLAPETRQISIQQILTTNQISRLTGYRIGAFRDENQLEASYQANRQECDKPLYDIDGNVYKTVLIGSDCWMAENLRTSKLNDGTVIPNARNTSKNQGGYFAGKPQWISLNNDIRNDIKFGKYYSRETSIQDNVCPVGWRVANTEDLGRLLRRVRDTGSNPLPLASTTSFLSTEGWTLDGIKGTNDSGFNLFPVPYFDEYNPELPYEVNGSSSTLWLGETEKQREDRGSEQPYFNFISVAKEVTTVNGRRSSWETMSGRSGYLPIRCVK